jgi:hypothetical protein
MSAQRLEELNTLLSLPQKKYFALDEANALLPKIEEHFQELIKIKEALHLLTTIDLDFEDQFLSHAKDIRFTKEFHKLSLAFSEHLDAIVSLGCFVKDVDKGLVDFYCKTKEGKVVFLCWKLGEDKIQHWHGTDTGFSGRRGIEEL